MKGFRKYIIVLFITIAMFAIAWFASSYFTARKISQIQEAQNQASIDVLSSETQFDLLQESSCQDIGNNYLTGELSELASKVTYAEQNFGDLQQLALLKQQYSVLEVKDFLLTKRISERCKQDVTTILYFYGNKDTCTDCTNEAYVLDAIRQKYPTVRIYSFDAVLDSSTVRALISVYKISSTMPSLVINGKTHAGFMSLDDVQKALPASITAPVTPAKTTITTKKASTTTTSTSATKN
jgi:glutaredoxin-related protein